MAVQSWVHAPTAGGGPREGTGSERRSAGADRKDSGRTAGGDPLPVWRVEVSRWGAPARDGYGERPVYPARKLAESAEALVWHGVSLADVRVRVRAYLELALLDQDIYSVAIVAQGEDVAGNFRALHSQRFTRNED